MIPTAQQKQAMIMIEKFIADKDSQVFILKGYAGTGKTTLIRSIADYLSAHPTNPVEGCADANPKLLLNDT